MYHFYSDSGHGWLKVNISELKKLGIENLISGFSYRKGDNVYLEEDQDMLVFIQAKGTKIRIKEHHSRLSRIRSYTSYYS